MNEYKPLKMRALITGISGQDGSYLAEHLLSLGYEVHGTIRRNSTPEHQESRIAHLEDRVQTYYADMMDAGSIEKVMQAVMPDEIYNLAAQSHVRISFDNPQITAQINAIGVMNILEAYRKICPNAKFYQASSSEMFGNSFDADGFQRETTPMHPVSPYGCSKLFAYSIVRNYRHAYNLHACNGILFNHESPRRGSNFVTNKIVKAAVRIKLGLQNELILGNMDSFRDWGHSKDYVRAMHLILNNEKADDFVVSTMQTYSISQFCDLVFNTLGLLHYTRYVKQDPKFMRPEELKYLRGDSSKIRKQLNWLPEYDLPAMVAEMIQHWINIYKK